MLKPKEKLALWILAVANPIICWSLASLLWKDDAPEKYRVASNASITVIVVVGVFLLLSLFAAF